MTRQPPVVLITGTSTGIGREAVLHLRDAGCHVIATARDVADIEDLAGDRVLCLALDVTRVETMQAAVATTLERFGRIDCLVNNAGYGAYKPVEETTPEDWQRMFDVNLFGLVRLTQLVLPSMRARRAGRIINVASVAGHLTLPMMGAYCASKFAVRAMSGALRAELKPWGLDVSLIEPGRIRTHFGKRAKAESADAAGASPYADLHARWQKAAINDKGAHPRVIASRIKHACTARWPRFHYLAPLDAKLGNLASRWLPDTLVNATFARYFWYRPADAIE